MPAWNILPGARLLADVSLWSADLANLEHTVARLSPFADSFHLDVADAHFVPHLLFFPDLVAALRPHTARPFHVHLMVDAPSKIVDLFLSAGADLITVHCETGDARIREAIARIRASGGAAGLALRLETPIACVEPYLEFLSAIVLLGTEPGVKGLDLAPGACGRIRELTALLVRHSLRARVLVIADGGIRRNTAPQLREAGAEAIVPGSLVLQSGNLAETFGWIHSLGVKA